MRKSEVLADLTEIGQYPTFFHNIPQISYFMSNKALFCAAIRHNYHSDHQNGHILDDIKYCRVASMFAEMPTVCCGLLFHAASGPRSAKSASADARMTSLTSLRCWSWISVRPFPTPASQPLRYFMSTPHFESDHTIALSTKV